MLALLAVFGNFPYKWTFLGRKRGKLQKSWNSKFYSLSLSISLIAIHVLFSIYNLYHHHIFTSKVDNITSFTYILFVLHMTWVVVYICIKLTIIFNSMKFYITLNYLLLTDSVSLKFSKYDILVTATYSLVIIVTQYLVITVYLYGPFMETMYVFIVDTEVQFMISMSIFYIWFFSTFLAARINKIVSVINASFKSKIIDLEEQQRMSIFKKFKNNTLTSSANNDTIMDNVSSFGNNKHRFLYMNTNEMNEIRKVIKIFHKFCQFPCLLMTTWIQIVFLVYTCSLFGLSDDEQNSDNDDPSSNSYHVMSLILQFLHIVLLFGSQHNYKDSVSIKRYRIIVYRPLITFLIQSIALRGPPG